MKKSYQWGILAAICVMLCGGGYVAYRHFNNAHNPVTQPVKYVQKKHVKLVALGDSLTHGQGDEKKQGGYVGIIKQKIERHYTHTKVTTVNYGVSGDRSDQILARLNSQKNIRQDLQSADVITMTVGGNDLMQTLEKSVLLTSQKQVQKQVNEAQKQYQKKLTALFNAVRQENPHAQVFVMSIYNPVYTYFPDVNAINDSINQWNRATQATMKQYHRMYFVDINHVMSYGQYQTSQQRQQLVQQEDQANYGKISQTRILKVMNDNRHNLNQYISTDDNFHPNHLGYEHIASHLFDQMKRHDGWEYVKE